MSTTAKVSPGAARLEREGGRERRPGGAAMAIIQDNANPLARLEQAAQWLAEARTLDELLTIREIAEATRAYARAAQLGRDAEAAATSIILNAERKAGELLAPTVSAGNPQLSKSVTIAPKLADLGITRNQSSQWQQMATIPEDVFVREIAAAQQTQKRVSHQQILKVAREYRPSPLVVVPQTDPALLGPSDRFHIGDILDIPWPQGKADLIVTSPPYALDKSYMGGDVGSYPQWLSAMAHWLGLMAGLANPGHGRLCLNIPLDRDLGGWQPVSADVVPLARAHGWKFRTWIIWNEGNAGAGTDRGSVDSASAPNVTAPVESILVFYRGEWRRPGRALMPHDDWLELCGPRGLWQFNGVPGDSTCSAPFPEELPRRCIELFSYPGDVVADPFVGRGTTAGVAARLGRVVWAADRDPRCVAAAQAWVARERSRP